MPEVSTRILSAFKSYNAMYGLDKNCLNRKRQTYSVQDTLGVEVLQPTQNLSGEGLGHFFIEFTMLAQTTGNRTTRNIFQETTSQNARQ